MYSIPKEVFEPQKVKKRSVKKANGRTGYFVTFALLERF